MTRLSFLSTMFALVIGPGLVRAADEFPALSVPVRVHLVHSKSEWTLRTTLTEADVQRLFEKVNKIWLQAGIHFEIESICDTPANEDALPFRGDEARWLVSAMPKDSRLQHGLDVFYVKEITPNGIWTGGLVIVKDTAKLREVPGGIDEPLPRVTAHELGHALGLAHRQDVTNLMASGTTGYSLNETEIKTARTTAETKYGPRSKETAPGLAE